ncbi:MAG: DUF2141 domain-containing protein [Alphaproteobacteria bacterium]|nr:DUF2141 domain-containing protein [Alphaproteobacteria bacterium]
MKLITATAACILALAVFSNGHAYADQVSLDVRVDNVRPDQGQVRVAVYDESTWLGEPVLGEQIDSTATSVTLRLQVPASGRYGLAAYQDTNSDGRLNRNVVGMPSEPTAFSNDAPMNFGPPRFADAALDVSAPSQAVLSLR